MSLALISKVMRADTNASRLSLLVGWAINAWVLFSKISAALGSDLFRVRLLAAFSVFVSVVIAMAFK